MSRPGRLCIPPYHKLIPYFSRVFVFQKETLHHPGSFNLARSCSVQYIRSGFPFLTQYSYQLNSPSPDVYDITIRCEPSILGSTNHSTQKLER